MVSSGAGNDIVSGDIPLRTRTGVVVSAVVYTDITVLSTVIRSTHDNLKTICFVVEFNMTDIDGVGTLCAHAEHVQNINSIIPKEYIIFFII